MTQLAGTNSVMGRFDGTEIVSGGLLYRVYQTNDQYWAEMPDPEIIMKAVETGRRINDHTYQIRTNGVLSMLDLRSVPRVNKRVVMTTGSHHYQTYWVEGSVRNTPKPRRTKPSTATCSRPCRWFSCPRSSNGSRAITRS